MCGKRRQFFELMLLVISRTVAEISGSDLSSSSTLRMELSTVAWLRPPNSSPISLRGRFVRLHGDLAGHGGLFAAALSAQICAAELERARGLLNNDVRRGDVRAGADDVLDGALDGVDRDRVVKNVAVGGQALDDGK